ncbi:hypothetical protein N8I77_003685 [Diaporthe amygdali]|uniref:Uncharacterized protein n=1 Tax=Phomopsis amygdali TaxID=1214568 RepID=A0AAD9SKH5_PHOAM|nr:hypothetical protein N8I77_003685 [Diaporthe amygdali]
MAKFGLPSYTSPPIKDFSSIDTLSYDAAASKTDRPLVTYVYSESKEARRNLQFFIAHGLHAAADFVFIFNGETDADSLVPDAPGIRSVRRPNTCYDLGSHAEVLSKDDLWRRYSRFILMNASVRGPFMPTWADGICWTERLLSKITREVKLAGISINCWPTPHIQSMVWATDSEGLSLLLHPPATSPRHDEWMEILFSHADDFPRPDDYQPSGPDWVEKGLSQCFANRQEAVQGEISATGIILGAGKKVDTLLTQYQTSREHNATSFCEPLGAWDPQAEGNYGGGSIHPFETMFIKTNRGLSPELIESLSGWTDQMEYSSYKQCS